MAISFVQYHLDKLIRIIEEMEKIRSEYAKKKLPIRLNKALFGQFLPKISQNKFKCKEKLTSVNPTSDKMKILTHKSQKVLSIPRKFIKNNTKVEQNMFSINTTSTSFYPTTIKTVSNSFYQKNHPTELSIGKQMKLKIQMHHHKQKHKIYLTPKTFKQIKDQFQQKYEKKLQENSRVSAEPINTHTKSTNRQITDIFQKNKHLYMLSRFTLLELKSYYSSILNFVNGDVKKFKYSIQIMLNLAGATVRECVLNESLKDFEMNGITFSGFLKLFTEIQQKLRKQAMVDYFQILLEEMQKSQFTYEELQKTFKGRMKKENAQELIDLLFQKVGKNDDQMITRKEIYGLCYNDQQFCNRFCTLNDENISKQMLKNQYKVPNLQQFMKE